MRRLTRKEAESEAAIAFAEANASTPNTAATSGGELMNKAHGCVALWDSRSARGTATWACSVGSARGGIPNMNGLASRFGGPAAVGDGSPLGRKLCVAVFRRVCRFVQEQGFHYPAFVYVRTPTLGGSSTNACSKE